MLHFRIFSIGIYKMCKANHYLLVRAIFHDMEITEVRFVNYVYQVNKLYILFWTCRKFLTIFVPECFSEQ